MPPITIASKAARPALFQLIDSSGRLNDPDAGGRQCSTWATPCPPPLSAAAHWGTVRRGGIFRMLSRGEDADHDRSDESRMGDAPLAPRARGGAARGGRCARAWRADAVF